MKTKNKVKLKDGEEERDLTEEELESLIQAIYEFEDNFYKIIAKSNKFEVIPLPDDNGRLLTRDELSDLRTQLKLERTNIVYKVGLKTHSVVLNSSDLSRIGVIPFRNTKEFEC